MRNVLRTRGLILIRVLVIGGFAMSAFAYVACREFTQVDACLDRGGCWDERHRWCEYEVQARCAPRGLPAEEANRGAGVEKEGVN